MSDEFTSDTHGIRGEIPDEVKVKTIKMLAKRIVEEKRGIPMKVRTIFALKENAPLIYRQEIDMQSTSS